MNRIIITAPSLDPTKNVSGVSSVVQFIIDNNPLAEYIHFELGKQDCETGLSRRINRIVRSFRNWRCLISKNPEAIVHYSFPLSAPSILRDPWFMFYALRSHKMVVHVHGGIYLTAENIPWLLRIILKWVFSWDIPFIVLSESEKSILQKRFNTKNVFVLPNCPDLSRAKECHRVPFDGKRPLHIGYLGRIEPNKGMTELLNACKILKKDGLPYVLDIAGKEQMEGEYLPLFERELEDNFHYSGLVSGDTKVAFLRGLDVFVMPTYFEGLPVSLLECMSYGVVPVVTAVGSIPEVVIEDYNGKLVEMKDYSGIVDVIKNLFNKADLLSRLSINAQDTIFSKFSVDAYISKLNAIYSAMKK